MLSLLAPPFPSHDSFYPPTLERSGQREDTLILFSSDNGPQGRWAGKAYPDDLKLTDFNQPLPMKGMKLDVWEGGIHVPGFMNWPGRISAQRIPDPVHIIDWFPTLAKLVDYHPRTPIPWDGVDLSGRIFRDEAVPPRDLYWVWNKWPNRWALRQDQWKIVYYGKTAPVDETVWQLFDLNKDPKEQHNLADQHPDTVATLHTLFQAQHGKDSKNTRP